MIKARNSRLALVDVAIEGFIWKPPLAGTQTIDRSTFKDPQPVVKKLLSSDDKADTQTEDKEEDI